MITEDQIIKWSGNKTDAHIVTLSFNGYAANFDVDTPKRVSAFLAQVIHESMGFKYSKEIASGKAYEGRKDLGNINAGDGIKFKGRGYIQITGRNNYSWISQEIYNNKSILIDHPKFLEERDNAMHSAFIFWDSRNLNNWADLEDFSMITRKINGGLNGFENRVEIYNKIRADYDLQPYKITV